jgi:TorA maturation chaperone TorD
MTAEATLAESLAFAGKAFLGADSEELRSLAAELEDVPSELRAALDDDPDELRKDYIRLFLSPSGARCLPWQSAHSEPPELMGPPHASALAWYRSAGFEPQARNDPADHVGLLLLFGARILQTGSGRFADFRREHLAWTAAFCAAVQSNANCQFYRELGAWLGALISDA